VFPRGKTVKQHVRKRSCISKSSCSSLNSCWGSSGKVTPGIKPCCSLGGKWVTWSLASP